MVKYVDANVQDMQIDNDYIMHEIILWAICATIGVADYR